MAEIYYKPHKRRKRELSFVNALIKNYNITNVVNSNYQLPQHLTSKVLKIGEVIELVDKLIISKKKRSALILELSKCPKEIKVVTNIRQISCDAVIVDDGTTYYFEFHEEQHRTLSVSRPSKIYTINNDAVIVPRYLQRLLRDIWRMKYLDNFTIVWADWFEIEGLANKLSRGFQEYYLPGKFTFINTLNG